MASVWTLTHGSNTYTLEQWGVSISTDSEFTSQAPDVVILDILSDADAVTLAGDAISSGVPAADVDWAYLDSITILQDGVQWFKGKVSRLPKMADGSSEQQSYQISGPWFDLDNILYLSTIGVNNAGSPETEDFPRVILGQDAAGITITTGQQITNILNYARTKSAAQFGSAPYTVGTIEAGFTVPPSTAESITCGNAIRQVLKFHPDFVTHFDYSTSPPTVHVTSSENLSAQSVTFGGADTGGLTIFSRDELIPSFVRIVYEAFNTVDGKTYRAPSTIDKYPPTATGELGAIHTIINLHGGSATTQEARIKTRNMPAPKVLYNDATGAWEENADFAAEVSAGAETTTWVGEVKARILEAEPWLKRLDIDDWGLKFNSWGQRLENPENTDDFPIIDPEVDPDNDPEVTDLYYDPPAGGSRERTVPNELIEGQLAPWMREQENTIQEAMVTCRAIIIWTGAAASFNHDNVIRAFPEIWVDEVTSPASEEVRRGREVQFRVRLTDAVSKTYRQTTSYNESEDPPEGIAQAMHESIDSLRYEGEYTLQLDEVDGTLGMGKKLNISGGLSAWSSMNSPIQSYRPNINSGAASVTFGPPSHLTTQDFVELARFQRLNPLAYYSTKEREDGESGGRQPIAKCGYQGPTERQTALGTVTHPFKVKIDKSPAGVYIATVEHGAVWVDQSDATTNVLNNGPIYESVVPSIDGTALNASPPPFKEVALGSEDVCWFEFTVDSTTLKVTAIIIDFGTAVPGTDTATKRYRKLADLDLTGEDPSAQQDIKGNFYMPTGATGIITLDYQNPVAYGGSHVPIDLDMEFENGKWMPPKETISGNAYTSAPVWDFTDYEEKRIEFVKSITVGSPDANGCVSITPDIWEAYVLVRGLGGATTYKQLINDPLSELVFGCPTWQMLEYTRAVDIDTNGDCLDVTVEHTKIPIITKAVGSEVAVTPASGTQVASGTPVQVSPCSHTHGSP